MGVVSQWVRFGEGRSQSAYLAMPDRAQAPLPSVVVIQEAWGVDAHIEDVARRVALAGYAAFAPDLFSKDNVRVSPLGRDRITELQGFMNALPVAIFSDPKARDLELAKLEAPQRTRIEETLKAAYGAAGKFGDYLPSVLAATAYLRDQHAPTKGQPVLSIGFCMGGGLSALLACSDPKLAGAAMYYGSVPSEEQSAKLACPLIGFFGETDKRLSDPVPAYAEAMKAKGKPFEPHIYKGVGHAFFNDTRPNYHLAASRDAWARTLGFFRTCLGSLGEVE